MKNMLENKGKDPRLGSTISKEYIIANSIKIREFKF